MMIKLSELTKDNIRNTKIHVKNEHESKAFQEWVFGLGGAWSGLIRTVEHLDSQYLFISSAANIYVADKNGYTSANNVPELRIDFTNKPDWEVAPSWANWLAQDASGKWVWHKNEPIKGDRQWDNDETFGWASDGIPNPNWRDTLEERTYEPKQASSLTNAAKRIGSGGRGTTSDIIKKKLYGPNTFIDKCTSDGSTANYYKLPEGATELQHLISYKDMNAQVGEIFRACYRYGEVSHSPKERDIKKIIFYAQAELERLQSEGGTK